MADDKNTLQQFGASFQTKVLRTLLLDSRLLDSLNDIIDKKFFDSDASKWIIEEIQNYYTLYHKTPTMDVFKVATAKIDSEPFKKTVIEQLRLSYQDPTDDDYDYIKEQFREFCINQNWKNVIYKSVDLLKDGHYDKIKDMADSAMKVGVETDLGMDYVSDYEERVSDEKRDTIPTGWAPIDDLMDGGLGPGELGVIVGSAGSGKTWLLCHIGAEAVKAGRTVVHYTMELSQKYVGQRYDVGFSGIPSCELAEHRDEVYDKIKRLKGHLTVKYFPPKTVTARTLQTHIEKMTIAGHKPELIIIDYADLMLSKNNRSDSTYEEQGGIYIELRSMSGELGIPVQTASQGNRASSTAEIIEADKIADSYAKVMTADFIMSLSRMAKDKINNTARMHIMKNRFGNDGMTLPVKMDTNHGIIEIYTPESSDGIATQKASKEGEVIEKKLLYKKYVELMPAKPKVTGLG